MISEIYPMPDAEKTTEELLDELAALRQRVAELEAAPGRCRHLEVECDRYRSDRAETEAKKVALEQDNLALQAAFEQTATILESISDAFVSVDTDWRYTYVNSQAEQVLGKPRSELIGKVVWEVFPRLVGTQAEKFAHQAVVEQKMQVYEEFYTSCNKWFCVRLYPSAQGLSVYFLDITDRKIAEKQIQLYADVVKNAQVGLTVWQLSDPNNPNSLRLLSANPATSQATGMNFEALIGRTIEEFPPEFKTKSIADCIEVIQTGQSENLGEVRYGEGQKEEVLSVKGFPLPNGCLGVSFENITIPKLIEESLREALQKLTFHVENSPLAVVEWDRNYRVSRWSQRAEEIFGWKAEEVLGKRWEDLQFVHPEDGSNVARVIDRLVKGTEQRNVLRSRNFTKDGEVVYCEWYSSALFDKFGNLESVQCLVLDVTDRKMAENALLEANRKTFTILESIAEGFSALDEQWRYTYLNPQGERILAVKREEVLGKNLWEVFPEAAKLGGYQELNRAMQSKVAVHYEEYYPPLNIWLDCHGYPLEGGGICIYYQDISSRKRMEETLRIHRERLDLVLRASQLGVWFCDLPFDKLEWNEKCKEHFGLSADTVVSIDLFYDRLHPEDREITAKAIAQSINERKPYDIVYRTVAPDGQIRSIRAIGSGFYNEAGTPIRFDGITVDVTEQKRQEEERDRLLQREQAARHLAELHIRRVLQLQELTASLAQALTTNDVIEVLLIQGLAALNAKRGWIAQYSNDGNTVEIVGKTGYEDEEIAPHRCVSLTTSLPVTDAIRTKEIVIVRSPQEYRDRYPEIAEHYIASGTQAVVAIPLIIEDLVMGSMGLSFTESQEFSEADCSFMLTLARQCAQALERARLYEAEKAARQVAESANRVKDEFLAVLSHELRSPLNPILGWSKLLRTRKFDPSTTDRALETIERNAKLQAKLIEDLLDVSRILRGKLSLNISPVNLIIAVEAGIETVRTAADAKSIQIKTALDPKAKQVLGDTARLQQIVWNLVSNAVKFTPNGGRVEVKLEAIGNQAQIQVIDTGKGIKPEFLPHVFDYFRQADSTTTRNFGGLGLGLAIVRHLVQLHGGTVHADSQGEGLGATFTVKIPLMVSNGEKSQDKEELSQDLNLKGVRVLVVDDEADMREFAAFVLEQFGAEAIVTSSANEALQVLINTKPDILLSDIGMPEVDGYMLMRQVRMRSPEQGGKIPAIALTAYAGEIDQKQALSAGFQLHIPKPVEPDKLISAIYHLIRQR